MELSPAQARKRIRQLGNPKRAALCFRFFKGGPGEYGEGDRFLGLTVPMTRAVVAQIQIKALSDLKLLFDSPYHEERLAGILVLVRKYEKAKDEKTRDQIYRFYLKHRHAVNNWDLVDTSASQIVGAHLYSRDRAILKKWIRSRRLWERRIAMISTHHFIRQNDFALTLEFSKQLFQDDQDLMHKASGWMLREVGKRDRKVLSSFLNRFAPRMPRTMLRYAIEHYPSNARSRYLRMK